MMDVRGLASSFLAPQVKTLSSENWARATLAYMDALDFMPRTDSIGEAFLALLADRPDALAAVLEFNQSDWRRARQAYEETYRIDCWRHLDDYARITICLQRALVTLLIGRPDPQYLPETAIETR